MKMVDKFYDKVLNQCTNALGYIINSDSVRAIIEASGVFVKQVTSVDNRIPILSFENEDDKSIMYCDVIKKLNNRIQYVSDTCMNNDSLHTEYVIGRDVVKAFLSVSNGMV